MAKLGEPITLPPLTMLSGNIWESNHMKAYALLEAQDAEARDRGDIVGRLLQFPAADGYAVYRITSAKPLTVAHVDYMDGWTVPAPLIRGLTVTYVKEELARKDRMAAFFAKKEAERA